MVYILLNPLFAQTPASLDARLARTRATSPRMKGETIKRCGPSRTFRSNRLASPSAFQAARTRILLSRTMRITTVDDGRSGLPHRSRLPSLRPGHGWHWLPGCPDPRTDPERLFCGRARLRRAEQERP